SSTHDLCVSKQPHRSQFVLIPHQFTISDQPQLIGFDCGSALWEQSLSTWITGQGVIDSMARGTRVWIYKRNDDAIIGYGSLGTASWNWPKGEIPSTEHVSVIPAIAIQSEYHGEPHAGDKNDRYSAQVMTHLLTEAHNESTRFVVLEVHESNGRAISFYESFGFSKSKKRIKKSFGAEKHTYLIRLF
ncbi:MAG: GNAT family N-acetyltransferase, partial [Planctomycetota bacterium]